MNCERLSFSQELSDQRISQAEVLLSRKIVQKILAYALFLLGANRSAISTLLNMPPGTIRSLVLAINRRGLSAFEDQRSKASSFKSPLPEQITPTIAIEDSWVKVDFQAGNLVLQIPDANPVQKKVVVLSLTNSGLLERSEAANALRLSVDRTGKLARQLAQEDVKGILDQRQGQRQDYRFTPEIKAELIKQFVIEAVAQRPTGGEQLAKKLEERCGFTLSARSILSHLSKLGLSGIRDSLSEHLSEAKKKSSNFSESKPIQRH
jgi:hypothetical protein